MKAFWKKIAAGCARGWEAFVHWQGWSDFVHWKGWSAFVHWSGWRRLAGWKLWRPHPLVLMLLCLASCGGLVWVFLAGRETSLVAYLIYPLSAYSLLVTAMGVPKIVRWVKTRVLEHPLVKPLLENEDRMFLLDLFREQIMNFGYGVFKTASGFWIGNPVIWTDGLYNLVQGIIQMGQLALHRKHLPLEKQWKSYSLCGWMILIGHVTMIGPTFLMIHGGEDEGYPGVMIFATAAWAFYKLINAIVEVAGDRKHRSPVDASVRLLDLTQCLFSLFSLQVALLQAFGDGSLDKMMNSMTGLVVCVMVMATGIYMIRRARRERKQLEGETHGRSL